MSSFIILRGTKMLLFDLKIKCHQHMLLYHIGCSHLLNEAPEQQAFNTEVPTCPP